VLLQVHSLVGASTNPNLKSSRADFWSVHSGDSHVVVLPCSCRYTAWWVPVPRLYAATLANDGHMPRGLVLAWRWSSWPDGAPSKRVFATHLGNPESQVCSNHMEPLAREQTAVPVLAYADVQVLHRAWFTSVLLLE